MQLGQGRHRRRTTLKVRKRGCARSTNGYSHDVVERYEVVDCVDGSSWAFAEQDVALVCAADVRAGGHEVEVLLVTERGDGRFSALPFARMPGRD